MKRLLTLLFLLASPILRADPNWNGTTNIGLATSSALTYSTSVVSVAFWVYPRATNTANQYFVESSLSLSSSAAATPRFAVGIFLRDSKWVLDCIGRGSGYRSQYILAAPNLRLNEWFHVGAVFSCVTSAGSFKMYLNGVAQTLTLSTLSSLGATAGTSWDGQKFCVGSENTNAYPANASISEVAIWKGELSAQQFANLAKLTPLQIGATPYVYWPMHPSGTEVPADLLSGLHLSLGTYTKTNISPALYRP